MNAENWSRDYKKQSGCYRIPWNNCASKWTYNQREKSFWMCQMLYTAHKKDVYENLPYNRIFESRYLTDRKYQIDICYKAYKEWVPMYWFRHRYKRLKWLIEINWKLY